jgi:hypothetical protein
MPNEMPIAKYTGGKPSLYIGNRNAKYTNARPVSFCRIENNIGKKQIKAATSCDFDLVKSKSALDRYFANANDVNILQVSTGCRFIKPRGIQLLDPFTVFPKTKVININAIPIAYNNIGVAVNNLLSVSKINTAITMQAIR